MCSKTFFTDSVGSLPISNTLFSSLNISFRTDSTSCLYIALKTRSTPFSAYSRPSMIPEQRSFALNNSGDYEMSPIKGVLFCFFFIRHRFVNDLPTSNVVMILSLTGNTIDPWCSLQLHLKFVRARRSLMCDVPINITIDDVDYCYDEVLRIIYF